MMEGKLIKLENNYHLESNGNIISGSHIGDEYEYKLSIKNCQAIENGYDLDELVKSDYVKHSVKDDKLSIDEQIQRSGGFIVGYKEGFQKALEILSDKKFSERDLDKAIEWGITNGRTGDVTHYDIDNFINSLQQTEWDVYIEMGGYKLNCDGEKYGFPDLDLLKLDENGCLILKRK